MFAAECGAGTGPGVIRRAWRQSDKSNRTGNDFSDEIIHLGESAHRRTLGFDHRRTVAYGALTSEFVEGLRSGGEPMLTRGRSAGGETGNGRMVHVGY